MKEADHRHGHDQVAPEIVRERKSHELKASDMWAVGVIAFYL